MLRNQQIRISWQLIFNDIERCALCRVLGRFHGNDVDSAGLEPIGDGVEVDREAGKFAHRFIVSIRRHSHKMGRAADVDAGGVGVSNRQRGAGLAGLEADAAIALGQGLLHRSVRRWHRIGYVV
jgi:hypothetical protein